MPCLANPQSQADVPRASLIEELQEKSSARSNLLAEETMVLLITAYASRPTVGVSLSQLPSDVEVGQGLATQPKHSLLYLPAGKLSTCTNPYGRQAFRGS